jgi:ABC-2 type transport system ATP-binding protein
MEEAAEISDRVGIMDHGELIALGTHQELVQLVGHQELLRLHFPEEVNLDSLASSLRTLPGVLSVASSQEQLVLAAPDAASILPGVVSVLQNMQISLKAIEIEEPSLEAVFLHLTGRGLRN